MEIEFFGVIGASSEDTLADAGSESATMINNVFSHYDLELKVINQDTVLKTLTNIEIQNIQAFDLNLNPNTIVKNVKENAKYSLIGKT